MGPGNFDTLLVKSVLDPLPQFASQAPLFSRYSVAANTDVNAMVTKVTNAHRRRGRGQVDAKLWIVFQILANLVNNAIDAADILLVRDCDEKVDPCPVTGLIAGSFSSTRSSAFSSVSPRT